MSNFCPQFEPSSEPNLIFLGNLTSILTTKKFAKREFGLAKKDSKSSNFNENCQKKFCQKWDSNPRPHSWTRTLSKSEESNS